MNDKANLSTDGITRHFSIELPDLDTGRYLIGVEIPDRDRDLIEIEIPSKTDKERRRCLRHPHDQRSLVRALAAKH